MNSKIGLFLTVILALVLSACASKPAPVVDGDGASGNAPSEDFLNAADSNAYGTGYSVDDLARLGIDGDPLQYRVVYFEYNSTAIDERSRVIAARHAAHLGERGGANVNLEGHADERGTRDYNLALGERRAQAVAQLMNARGAASSIQTISYGEERPVASEHNESAWQQNRRVEIKY